METTVAGVRNLTQVEAAQRARLLDVAGYDITLDLTDGTGGPGERSFRSTTEVRFTCAEPGAETFIELAAEGAPNVEIARLVGVSRPTVNTWRARYAEQGLAGLADVKRPGRKRLIDQRRIVAETLRPPPASLGVTHWSSRLLGRRHRRAARP